MSAKTQPVRLAGSDLGHFRHVCAFFHSKDEEYQVLLPFVKEGLEQGDKAFHIIDEQRRSDHLRRLKELGVDVVAAVGSGQLEVCGWENAHLRPGWFDQHAMLGLVEEVLAGSRQRGFSFTRWVADMGWSLTSKPGVEHLADYCSRLNYVVPRHEATVVCTYDLSRFSAAALIDVLRSHPAAIIGGILQENPFYVPPDEFLRERNGGSGPQGVPGER
jgi:hypothetical protein